MTIDAMPPPPFEEAPTAPQGGKKAKKEPIVWTEAAMLLALRRKYDEKSGWQLIEHVGDTTGFDKVRTADAVAMHTWPSRGYETIGFEIKISRSDWQRELKKPEKSASIQQYCHRWYLVVNDAAIVKPGELPVGWGLIAAKGDNLVIVTESPRAKPATKDDGFQAAMLRAVMKRSASQRELEDARRVGYAEGEKAGKKSQQWKVDHAEKQHEELKGLIEDFQARSGVDLRQRWNMGAIGEAVKVIMSGGLDAMESRIAQLVDSASSILSGLQNTAGSVVRARDQRLSAEAAIARGEDPAPAPPVPQFVKSWE